VQLNPHGSPTIVEYDLPRRMGQDMRPGHDMVKAGFPADAQVWSYPELGMRVVLQDRSLSGHFARAAIKDFDAGSTPDPRVLALREDVVSLGDGQAVFLTRPPREQWLDVRASVARFVGEGRPRIVVHVQVPGGPADSLWARWVVLDSTGREVARDVEPLGLSACDPAERRVGEFSHELPPGAFEVAVSARDSHRRRGVFRTAVAMASPPPGLVLSDIVLSCGDPAMLVGGSEVRLEANMDAEVSGPRPLVAYFEIAHLATGSEGRSRFEYEYAVRRELEASPGRRAPAAAPALLSAAREEAQAGALRRQFVSVPTQGLAEGRYRLTIRVRDLVGGEEAAGSVAFTRR